MSDPVCSLGNYPTPMWLAEQIVERYFSDLDRHDLVIEPSCGSGHILQAIPAQVAALGVEIDPVLAAIATSRTGRPVVVGDFRTAPLNVTPTVIIGNPPFQSRLIDGFLARAHRLLPEGGRAGFLLPAYSFQAASRVVEYARRWSITAEMIPRNVYRGLKLPLVFAVFSKDRRRTLVGFAFYREADAVQNMPLPVREVLTNGGARGSLWRSAVWVSLEQLGGEGQLSDIYATLQGRRPTANPFWRERVRAVLQKHFRRTGTGRYALPAQAEMALAT